MLCTKVTCINVPRTGTARGHVCPRRRKACRRNNRSKCKKSPVVKCLQGGDPRGGRRTRPRVQSPAPRGGIKFPPRHRGCSGTGCTHGMRRSDDELPLRPVLARPPGSPVRLQRSRPRPLRPLLEAQATPRKVRGGATWVGAEAPDRPRAREGEPLS